MEVGGGIVGARSRALAAAAVVAAAAALVAVGPPGRALDWQLASYLLIRLRGPVELPPERVVIIAQDKAAAAALGQPTLDGWPRRDLARVVEQANAAGARAL